MGLSGLVSFLWRICEGGLSMENLLACFICFRKLFGECICWGRGGALSQILRYIILRPLQISSDSYNQVLFSLHVYLGARPYSTPGCCYYLQDFRNVLEAYFSITRTKIRVHFHFSFILFNNEDFDMRKYRLFQRIFQVSLNDER